MVWKFCYPEWFDKKTNDAETIKRVSKGSDFLFIDALENYLLKTHLSVVKAAGMPSQLQVLDIGCLTMTCKHFMV
jgi:hypothetical protein